MSIKIQIQYNNEDILSIDANKNEKIIDLIPKIIKAPQLQKENYLFVLNENILENQNLISSYDISKESVIIMIKKNIPLEEYISQCQKVVKINDKTITYKEILNNIKDYNCSSTQYYIHTNANKGKKTYSIIFQNNKTIIFNEAPFTAIINKIEIKLEKERIIKKIIIPNICCLEEIKDFCKDNLIDNPYVLDNGKNKIYLTDGSNILKFIKDGLLNIYYINEDKYKEYFFNTPKILLGNFKPKDLTDNFFEIFKYNNKEKEENEDFIYFESEEREKLSNFFENLVENENLHTFKFAGPKNCGKTTTLLNYSRYNLCVMYLNCKLYHELELKDKKTIVYNDILKEFERMIVDPEYTEKIKSLFKKCKGKSYTDIIYEIIKFLETIKSIKIIILDQVNEYHLKSEILNKYINFIKEKETKIKLIICSSINNYEIEDEVLKTIKNNINFDKGLNEENQDYYYYCGYLYEKKIDDNNKLSPIFKLFRNQTKYIYSFEKSNNYKQTFSEIRKTIENDIKNFLKGKDIFSISDILIFIKNNIQNENVSIPYQLLKFIPLKYFSIKKKYDNYFQINYDFPYIEYILESLINIEDCDNYFKTQRYQFDFLKGNVKGLYFEYSCIYHINNSTIFGTKIEKYITLESIAKYDKIIEEIEDFTIKNIEKENDSILNDINTNDNNSEETNTINKNEINNIEDYSSNEKIFNYDNNIKSQSEEIIAQNNLLKKKTKRKKDSTKNKKIDEFNKNIKTYNNLDETNKLKEFKKLSKNITFEDFEQNLPEKLLKEINSYFYDIEYYRKKTILNDSLPKYKGYEDENIGLRQKKITGECLDYALLLGNQKNKKFLGIQIKCYSPDTTGGNFSSETKSTIKEKCQNVINGIKSTFDIDIKEWHYLLILYYNIRDKEGKPNKFLVNHCIKNNLEYMFYDPEKKQFLNKDLQENFKFKLNDLTNLDSLSYNFKNSDIYEYNPEEKIETKNELVKGYQQYFNDTLSFYYQFNFSNQFITSNLDEYMEKLSNNISELICNDKSFEFKFILLKKIYFEWIPQIPKNFHMSAFVNSNGTNFIFLLHINKDIYGIDYENNNKIGILSAIKLINSNINYFYFFKIIKQKKKKTDS